MARIVQTFWLSLLTVVVLGGVMGALVWGTSLPQFAIWKFMVVLFPLMVYGLVFLLSRHRLQFMFFTLLALWPVLGIAVPPKRLGLSVLDALIILVVPLVVDYRVMRRVPIKLVPEPWLLVALIGVLLCCPFSVAPALSFGRVAELFGEYMVFLLVAYFLAQPGVRAKLPKYWAFVVLIVSFFIVVARVTGINFSFSTANLNAVTYVGSAKIIRAGGLFQDPQKAGQFLAVSMAVLTVLWVRGALVSRFVSRLVLAALLAAAGALLITVSKNAIAMGFLASGAAFLLFGRGGWLKRGVVVTFPILAVLAFALAFPSTGLLGKLVPRSVKDRFSSSQLTASVGTRWDIWVTHWPMFADNPFTGVGPGAYREYLMQQNPALRELEDAGGYVPDQPESGFLNILYETGLLGAVPTLILIGVIALRLLRMQAPGNDLLARTWALACLFGGAVFLATYVTLFTTSDSRNLMLVVVLLALARRPDGEVALSSKRPVPSQARAILAPKHHP